VEICDGGRNTMNNIFFKMPEKIFGISSSLIKLFLLPLGVILVFLASLSWVIIPRFDSISSVRALIKDVKSTIKITEQKMNYLNSVDQEELLNNENYLLSAVLQEKNSYLLVGVIRNITDKFGYRVKSFSISPTKLKDEGASLKVSDENVATKLPIEVVLEGPEDRMVDLLISIENSLPVMFIDKIGIASRLNVSEVSLTVSSYYVADNQNLVSGNLTLNDLIPTIEESNLLSKLSQFDKSNSLTQSLSDQNSEQKVYTDYSRSDPFSP
jgi:hypothetical protein